ncbi:MAG: CotH kinase family protein [Chloroflexota bacterium]
MLKHLKSKPALAVIVFIGLVVTTALSGRWLLISRAADVPLHVNAGSMESYTSEDGRVFQAEQTWAPGGWGFINGEAKAVSGFELYATGGTDVKPVFGTQKIGWSEFRMSDISNDDYLITLYFREERAHGPGMNRFTILAEGQPIAENVDVYANVGRDYALLLKSRVQVSDGELNITMQNLEGVPFVSAISVEKFKDDSGALPAPEGVVGSNSYDAAQLFWNSVPIVNVSSYNIFRSTDGGAFEQINAAPVYINRYQDRTAELGKTYRYQVQAVDVSGRVSGLSTAVSASRLSVADATLPVYSLTIDPADWEFMYAFPFDENTVTGTLTFEDEDYDVTVRYRGAGSRLTNKKNWKLKFQSDSPWDNQDTLNLNADNMDFSYMRGPLSYRILNQIGIDAPQQEYALLFINGQYMGVYNDYEQIDEHYMERTGRNDDTIIYKAKTNLFVDLNTTADYETAYEKNNKRISGHTEIVDLVESLSGASDDEFPWLLQNKFDIKSYLDTYAYAVWVGQYDFFEGNNYLLYDEKIDKWELIPWDFDFAFGNVPSTYDFNSQTGIDLGMADKRVLPQRGVNVPQYRQYVCHQLEAYANNQLLPGAVQASATELHGQMINDARRDWLKVGWQDSRQLETLPTDFANYIAARKLVLDGAIPDYCAPYNRPYLKINEVVARNDGAYCDPAGVSGGCADDWIEIYNPGLLPVDLNGMFISNNPNNPLKHKINGSIIVEPLGYAILWADNEPNQGARHLTFELEDAAGTVVLADSTGNLLDSLSWNDLDEGYSAARLPDGTQNIKIFAAPTHGTSNTQTAPEIDDVVFSPAIPQASDSMEIQATVSDEGEFDVYLHYQIDGSGFIKVPMQAGPSSVYQASIGPRPDDSRVQYYISAADRDGNVSTNPTDAPNNAYEYVVGYESPTLFINEIMASNKTTFYDPDEPDEAPDYAEIFNPGPWAVNLASMYVTDTLTKTRKYRLAKETDQLIIQPGEHLVIIVDDDGKQGPNHTGFKLAKDGEAFGLFDRKDLGNSQIDGYSFGPQETDVAIGRCGDGGAWQVLPEASPGQPNAICNPTPPTLSNFQQSPQFPLASTSNPVMLKIDATDNSSVTGVQLIYRFAGGSWITVDMTQAGDTFSYQIPGIAQRGLVIEYYFQATDNSGLKAQYPLGGSERHLSFMYHTTQPELYPEYAVQDSLMISELVAVGGVNGLKDPAEPSESTPWVEIYNGSDQAIDLTGYRLANTLFFPREYTIPAGIMIEANSYLTFYLDDDPEQGPLHASIIPIRTGDTISLHSPFGIQLDSVTYTDELESGGVFVRDIASPSAVWEVTSCTTPGTENVTTCGIYLPLIRR